MGSPWPRSGPLTRYWSMCRATSGTPAHRWSAVLAVVVVAAVSWVATLSWAAAPLYAQDAVAPGSSTATLPPGRTATVTLPVHLPDGVTRFSVAVQRVRRGAVEIDADDATVEAEAVSAMPGVRLTLAGLVRPAVYEVTVGLTHSEGRQTATFLLERPAARVRVPESVAVDNTVLVPEWGWDRWGWIAADVDRPPFSIVVDEDSQVVGFRTRAVEPAPGAVALTVPEGPHGPGAAVTLDYQLEGRFPLGTQTRTVELLAPELAEPAVVTFAVTTRRHPALLVALIVAGVLLGALVRTVIPALTGATAARRRAAELRGKLDALEREHEDPTFRDALDAARGRVTGLGLRGRRAVGKAIDAALAEVEAAAADFRARFAAEDARLRALAPIIDPPLSLPPPVAQPLDDVRTHRDAAEGRLDVNDAAGAQKDLDKAQQVVELQVAPAAAGWLRALRDELEALGAPLAGRTAGAQSRLRRSVEGLLAGLPGAERAGAGQPAGEGTTASVGPSVMPVAGSVELSQVGMLLRSVHAAMTGFAGVRAGTQRVADEAAHAAEVLEALPGDNAVLSDLTARVDALRRAASADPTDPLAATQELLDPVTGLMGTLRDAVVAPLEDARDQHIEDSLAAGDVAEALRKVQAKVRKPAGEAERTRLGDVVAALTAQAAADTAASAATAQPSELTLTLPAPRPRPLTRLRLAPQLAVGFAVSAAALVLQTLIVLGFVVIVGYPLFGADWAGTAADMSKVLVWAFAVDLSVEGLRAITAGRAPAGQ